MGDAGRRGHKAPRTGPEDVAATWNSASPRARRTSRRSRRWACASTPSNPGRSAARRSRTRGARQGCGGVAPGARPAPPFGAEGDDAVHGHDASLADRIRPLTGCQHRARVSNATLPPAACSSSSGASASRSPAPVGSPSRAYVRTCAKDDCRNRCGRTDRRRRRPHCAGEADGVSSDALGGQEPSCRGIAAASCCDLGRDVCEPHTAIRKAPGLLCVECSEAVMRMPAAGGRGGAVRELCGAHGVRRPRAPVHGKPDGVSLWMMATSGSFANGRLRAFLAWRWVSGRCCPVGIEGDRPLCRVDDTALTGATPQVAGVAGVHPLRRADLLARSRRLFESLVVPASEFGQRPVPESVRNRVRVTSVASCGTVDAEFVLLRERQANHRGASLP